MFDIKRYIVFSDIHGDKRVYKELKGYTEGNDGAFFAGDGLSMLKDFTDKDLFAVGGNCDLGGAPEIVTEIEGVRVLLTHGHKYGVKGSLLSLKLRAAELECGAVIFGHTHQPLCSYEGGILFLNPGTCSDFGSGGTYAILTLDNGTARADISRTNS